MDLRDYSRLYDIRVILNMGNKDTCVCPLPQHIHSEHPTPSFSVFISPDGRQRFKCHGTCGLQGDVIDLMGFTYIPHYDPNNIEHIKMAVARLSDEFDFSPVKVEDPVRLAPSAWKLYHPPEQEVIDYAQGRGLGPRTLEHFKIGGGRGAMSIPAFTDDILRGIKFRSTRNTGLRYWSEPGSKMSLFNHDEVYMTRRPVLFLKAEIPVMLAWQNGLLACASTGGETSDVSSFLPALAMSPKIIIVPDNDRDPKVREQIMMKAHERALVLRAEIKLVPGKYKDWDEWVLDRPYDALVATRSWL